jgi:hypothetical protein
MGFTNGGAGVASKLTDDFFKTVANKIGAMVCDNGEGKLVQFDPITLLTLITTLGPMLLSFVKKCRGIDNYQEVQQSVAEHNQDAKLSVRQRNAGAAKILAECRRLANEERRKAKKAGLPADIGRYQIDTQAALRIVDHGIGTFTTLPAAKAAAIVAACKE